LSSPEAPETEAGEAEVADVDEERQALLEAFQADLGDAVVGSHIRAGDDLWIRVTTEAWREAADVARAKHGMRYFCVLSGIDWRPSPFGRYEDSEIDTPVADKLAAPFELASGFAGGETRFQVFARVRDVIGHRDLTLKADVPDDTMTVPSWTPVYAGADWHERETWEMLGISFEGHPDLRHLYLPTGFEGFPLRKDYPLLARVVKPWPGIVDVEPMPGGDDSGSEGEGGEAE
jgi:NADH-quinone oxidoreductase subunit C